MDYKEKALKCVLVISAGIRLLPACGRGEKEVFADNIEKMFFTSTVLTVDAVCEMFLGDEAVINHELVIEMHEEGRWRINDNKRKPQNRHSNILFRVAFQPTEGRVCIGKKSNEYSSGW